MTNATFVDYSLSSSWHGAAAVNNFMEKMYSVIHTFVSEAQDKSLDMFQHRLPANGQSHSIAPC